MAHGGSLTINPHTGLPEAGFLESVLPMVLGAGLAATGIGAPVAALMVGGGYGLAKGDLKEGLMAGLSAYGGAGLASGLAAAGTQEVVKGAGEAALKEAGTETALEAGKNTAANQLQQEAAKQAALEGLPKTQAADFYRAGLNPTQIAQGQAQNFLGNAANTGNLSADTIQGLKGAIPNTANPLDIVNAAGQANAAAAPNVANPTLSNIGKGLGSLGSNPSQIPGFVANNAGSIAAAAAPALSEQQPNIPGGYQPDAYDRRLAAYRLSPDYQAYEAPRPNPYYQAQYPSYAEGGAVGYAMGGQPNQMYPMSQQEHTNFMDPTQLPSSAMEVRNFEPATNPMTGGMTKPMRKGGIAHFDGGGVPIELHGTANISGQQNGGNNGYGSVGGGFGGGFGNGFGGQQAQQQQLMQGLTTEVPPPRADINSGLSYEYDRPPSMPLARFASGGVAQYAGVQGSEVLAPLPESTSIPRTGIYRDTDLDTYKKDALEAAIIRLGKSRKAAGLKGVNLPKTSIKGLGDVSGATPDTTDAARGGVMRSHLGSYSDGGRMLKGPGDGMSDSIPATISGKQPARLADGEFVVPADVVSHLGNGSTDAGAKKLYSMMDKIRKARTGKKKQAPAVKADRFMPA
jgi:hypothetical protein